MSRTGVDRLTGLVELGRYDEAKRAAASLLAEDPGSVEARCLLARAQLGAGEPGPAVQTARSVLGDAPDDEWALRLLALGLHTVNDRKAAIRAARRATEVAPSLPESFLALAAVSWEHEPQTAVDAAREAIRLDPHDANAHNRLGLALSELGRRRDARAAYDEALRLDPQHALARNNRAVLDLRWRPARATRGIVAALRSAPQEAVLRGNLDVVGEQLLVRLLLSMVLGGAVLLAVLEGEASGALPWYARPLVGLGLLVAYAGAVWLTLRHVPAGMRRHLRTLPRRSTGRWRWGLLIVVTVTLLLLAFAPGDVAPLGVALFAVIIPVLQFAALFWVVRRVVTAIYGATRGALRR